MVLCIIFLVLCTAL